MNTMDSAFQREKVRSTTVSQLNENVSAFLQVLGASLFLAFCSQIKIVLPFTIVPITFQTLAVLLIGATLGSRKGAYAILLYFAEILIGMPVLAGGVSDPFIFFGPKGGYVLGFCLQAFVMGLFTEHTLAFKSIRLMIGGLVACSLQIGLGAFVLAQFVGWTHVWAMGIAPFIPGEMLKILCVALGLQSTQFLSLLKGK